MQTLRNSASRPVAVAVRPRCLRFTPVASDDIATLTPMLARSASRSCDFTAGGIFMWVGYFGYEKAVYANTLFIRGLSEDSGRRPSFSLPVGALPLAENTRVSLFGMSSVNYVFLGDGSGANRIEPKRRIF